MTAKSRLSVYLEPGHLRGLEAYAREHGISKSLAAEAAIVALLAPDITERQENALIRRLDRQSRAADRLERNLMILTELVALYVRQWLVVAPSLPETAQATARARGRERFRGFITTLGRQLAQGRRLDDDLDLPDVS